MKITKNLLHQPLFILFTLLSVVAMGTGLYFSTRSSPPVAPPATVTTPPKLATLPPKVQSSLATPTTVATKPLLDELATPTTTAGITQFHWQANARQTYRYRSQVDLKIDMNATFGQKGQETAWQSANSELSGILNVRIFDKKNERIRMGFQLSEARFSINGQSFPPLLALFQTFFLVEMSPQGKPLYFHFPRYIDPANQPFVKEIANSVQVVLTADNAAKIWNTQETHNSGHYQATYQRKVGNEIHKRKLDYLNVTLQQTNEQLAAFQLIDKIKESSFTAQIAAQHSWLEKLNGQEKIDFSMATGKLVEMVSQVQLALSNDPQDPHLGIWQSADNYDRVLLAFAEATGDVSLSQDVIKQLELDKLRQQYAHANVTALVDVLYTKFGQADSISSKDMLPFIRGLEEYFIAYPDAALELPALLDKLNPGTTLSAYLIGALEHAGTPQAQQALSMIATNTKPEGQNRAIQAIMSFNFIEKPQPHVAATLWQLADGSDSERASTALLAIGSVVKNSTDMQQVELREQLIERLQHSTEEQQNLLLGAMGNTQDNSLLPNIEPYLNVPQMDIRSSAISALRSFDDPISLNHIVTAATTDEHREVRRKALDTLEKRTDKSQATPILRERLPQETDTELRTNLIQFLGEHKADDPQVVETLQQQLKQEQNREMRKELYNAIYR